MTTEKELAELYVAILGRAPDAGGLAYWLRDVESGATLEQIGINWFNEQPEVLQKYENLDTEGFIAEAYQNAFGRQPDPEGLEYWKPQVASGEISREKFINAIILGAKAPTGGALDAAILSNRAEIGIEFSRVVKPVNTVANEGTSANSLSDDIIWLVTPDSGSVALARAVITLIQNAINSSQPAEAFNSIGTLISNLVEAVTENPDLTTGFTNYLEAVSDQLAATESTNVAEVLFATSQVIPEIFSNPDLLEDVTQLAENTVTNPSDPISPSIPEAPVDPVTPEEPTAGDDSDSGSDNSNDSGSGGDSGGNPTPTFTVTESAPDSGIWTVGTQNGSVAMIIESSGDPNVDYVKFTPTIGNAVSIPLLDIDQIVVNSITLTTSAELMSRLTSEEFISLAGNGTLVVTDLVNAPFSNLSTVDNTLSVKATVDFGSALITQADGEVEIDLAGISVIPGAIYVLDVNGVQYNYRFPPSEENVPGEVLIAEGLSAMYALSPLEDTSVSSEGGVITITSQNQINSDGVSTLLTLFGNIGNAEITVAGDGSLSLSMIDISEITGELVPLAPVTELDSSASFVVNGSNSKLVGYDVQLTGKSITGEGDVAILVSPIIFDENSAPELNPLDTSGFLNTGAVEAIVLDGQSWTPGWSPDFYDLSKITEYQVGFEARVILTAAQADGKPIIGEGGADIFEQGSFRSQILNIQTSGSSFIYPGVGDDQLNLGEGREYISIHRYVPVYYSSDTDSDGSDYITWYNEADKVTGGDTLSFTFNGSSVTATVESYNGDDRSALLAAIQAGIDSALGWPSKVLASFGTEANSNDLILTAVDINHTLVSGVFTDLDVEFLPPSDSNYLAPDIITNFDISADVIYTNTSNILLWNFADSDEPGQMSGFTAVNGILEITREFENQNAALTAISESMGTAPAVWAFYDAPDDGAPPGTVGDSFIFMSDGISGLQESDVLIHLVGVSITTPADLLGVFGYVT